MLYTTCFSSSVLINFKKWCVTMKFDIGPKLINHAFALRAFLRVTNFAKPEMEGGK